jgi:signal transduction histidine kinase/streptogramin lyase
MLLRGGFLLLAFLIFERSPAQTDSVQFVEASPRFATTLTRSLLQDTDGFLWIMEPWRLYRFDGISYDYYHSGKGSRSFGENLTFQDLWGGRKNWLCISASVNSLVFLNTETMRHQVVTLPQPDCSDDLRISCVMEDSRGRFWVGSDQGKIVIVEPPDMAISRLYDCDGADRRTMRQAVRALIDDEHDNVWIGTDAGLFLLPGEAAGSSVDLSRMRAVAGLPADTVVQLTRNGNDRIWVCLSDGSIGTVVTEDLRFDRVTRIPSPSPGQTVTVFLLDHTGDVWIATPMHGLMRWNRSRSVWSRHLMHTDPSGKSYPAIVNDAIVDRDGILWVLNASSALMKYDSRPRPFQSYAPNQGSGPRLSGRDVDALCIDKRGGLWVGLGSSGLDYLTRGGRSFMRFVHDPDDPGSLASNRVVCLRAMQDGTIWAGTYDGISVYDHRTRRFGHYRHDPADSTSLGDNVVTTIYEDSHSIIWVGHALGLDTFDRSTGEFSSVIRWPQETIGLVGSVAMVFEDSRGDFWVGTAGRGLLRISASLDTLWYHANPAMDNALPDNRVAAAYEDSEGHLWFGMYDKGLVRFDRDSERFEQFKPMYTFMSHGIGPGSPPPPQVLGVHGILEDRRGDLWLALQGTGVARFDVRRQTFRRYDEKDGVIVVAGRRSAFCALQDGTIFFGGPGGVTWFHPDSIPTEEAIYNAPVVITEFRVNQEVRPISQDSTKTIVLSYSENSCSFAFAMLDYSDPGECIYEYKLEGLDADWSFARTDHKVRYASIPPGEYRFRVRAANSAGSRSIREASMPLVIAKPYWLTWWFVFIILLCLAGITYTLHRVRLARVTALERLRLRIASDLHDEIGSNLGSIALQGQMITRLFRLPADVQARMKEIVTMAHDTSQSIRDIVWLINPEHDRFGDLVLKMKETAAKMLEGMEYDFRASDGASGGILDTETKRTTLLMYKEALNNILRHANAQHVLIEMCTRDGLMVLKVQDDGVGFAEEHPSNGDGIANMRRRAAAMGGTVRIESKSNDGTTVEMEIPLSQRRILQSNRGRIPPWIGHRQK